MNNKVDIKMIPKHGDFVQSGIDWLKKNGYATEIDSRIKETVPKSYELRVFEINCRGSVVTVRKWTDMDISNPEIKSVTYRQTFVGLILLAGSNTISKYIQKMGIVYKDGDSLENLINKILPGAELVK
jgi:hypothetical protein